MRYLVVALVVVATAFCLSERSQAMALAAPAGIARAVETTQSVESVGYRCHRVQYCTPTGCEWHRACFRGCPDGISCYPLYGHYGPWGGRSYWGSYSNTW